MIAKIRNQQVPEVNFPLIMLIVTQFLGLLTNQNNFAVDMALLVFSFFFTRKVDIKYIIISAVFVLLILARYLTGHSAVKGYFAPIHHCTKYLNTFFGISVCCLIQYMSEREKKSYDAYSMYMLYSDGCFFHSLRIAKSISDTIQRIIWWRISVDSFI